jgi:hypothetical protein
VTEPWWKSLAGILWWMFSRVFPPLIAVGFPALAFWGAVETHDPYRDALQLNRREFAILVGTATDRHSYVVLPRNLTRASISVVSETDDTFIVTESAGQMLGVLLLWIVTMSATWLFWFRRGSQERCDVEAD